MEVFLRKHFWVFNLVVIAVVSGFCARAVSHWLAGAYFPASGHKKVASKILPPPAPPRSKEDIEILKRNIFCSTCPPIVPIVDPDGHDSVASGPQRTQMPLRLILTFYGPDDPAWSMAVICDTQTRECGPFRAGSPIKEGTVTLIEETKVTFDVHGRTEFIDLEMQGSAPTMVASATPPPPTPAPGGSDDPLAADLDKGVRKNSDTDYQISRELLDKVLSDTSMLARSARIVPNVVDGKSNGFKLYAIRPNSVYARIGLQNGDTIHAINGMDMSSPDKALEVYTKLRRASHLSVSITRRGASSTLDYSIR